MQKAGSITINGSIHAYDINPVLINTYKYIQSNKDELFDHIARMLSEYNARCDKQDYYYQLRSKYNNMDHDSVECSAIFIFLNKTCFKGLYRENHHGEFNASFGHYKKTPNIITKHELDNISALIQPVKFSQSDFIDSIQKPAAGDFVYLDPPYVPVSDRSFVSYSSSGFSPETHQSLFRAPLRPTPRYSLGDVQLALPNRAIRLRGLLNHLCSIQTPHQPP
jgi:DNA adenine methylase